ncbi:hypothetical protein [Pseudonocardia parietis]|uniref:DUF1579 domain-containing protein n=1 Tax=Pseudonocardia parietis TaxID=570936 RepID=A0ABS4VXX3_9PSEU|nr:hypothetical protein [Pseudonocardia parietis]MBP2368319.1 hypothetical protein [Pseudonocardia parietis]
MAQQRSADPLAPALHTDGPHPDLAGELALFGRFVGSWRLDWHGSDRQAVGELHVGWVLGGRAVQDTWIVPGPGEPGHGVAPLAFHGTTIRFPDPVLGAWRSTWVEPVNGRVRRFVGRPTGWGIELLSDEDDPQLRWTFSEITADFFTWIGSLSTDGGESWQEEERMYATRVRGPAVTGAPPIR